MVEAKPNRALLIVAVMLAALGAGALLFVALAPDATPAPGRETASPRPSVTNVAVGARFAKQGDCLINDGTEAEPVLRLVSCAPQTFVVLARFESVTDADKACDGVAGYEYNYSYDSPLDDSLDFVLCLKTAQK